MVDGATDLPGIHSLEATSDPGLYEQDPQYLCLPTLVVSEDDSSLGGLSIEHDIHDPCHEVNSGVILRQQVLSRDHLGRTENLAQNSFVSVGSKYPALPRGSFFTQCCDMWKQQLDFPVKKQLPFFDKDGRRRLRQIM
ncbi:hypothetical protein GUJ93_ZPchr0002g24982 [Zizania palustris]|uniref:Uncharacterized protein n=1 Tax=Zizania palustris TaxID=103762 RepID=A0A8J5REK0_ZIZPA|nr:hypothetical protein GUJ93_ZPchr0002g24982 [Zizania palustris]